MVTDFEPEMPGEEIFSSSVPNMFGGIKETNNDPVTDPMSCKVPPAGE